MTPESLVPIPIAPCATCDGVACGRCFDQQRREAEIRAVVRFEVADLVSVAVPDAPPEEWR